MARSAEIIRRCAGRRESGWLRHGHGRGERVFREVLADTAWSGPQDVYLGTFCGLLGSIFLIVLLQPFIISWCLLTTYYVLGPAHPGLYPHSAQKLKRMKG